MNSFTVPPYIAFWQFSSVHFSCQSNSFLEFLFDFLIISSRLQKEATEKKKDLSKETIIGGQFTRYYGKRAVQRVLKR